MAVHCSLRNLSLPTLFGCLMNKITKWSSSINLACPFRARDLGERVAKVFPWRSWERFIAHSNVKLSNRRQQTLIIPHLQPKLLGGPSRVSALWAQRSSCHATTDSSKLITCLPVLVTNLQTTGEQASELSLLQNQSRLATFYYRKNDPSNL